MSYIEVLWHHESSDYPVRLVSELDDDRWELRKLEFYRDGRMGWACGSDSMLGTELSLEAIPSVEVIGRDREFSSRVIEGEDFERLWVARLRRG
jgi:hypothetical protein